MTTRTAAASHLAAAPDPHAALTRLCAIGFLAYCSYAICRTPLLPLLAHDLGADPPMVGFVVGASTLTGILVKLPVGASSDIVGRRPMLILGTIVFAVMPFTYLGVATLGALVTVRFLHGAATAIVGPVASASLSDIAPHGRRATWLSTYSTIQGTGQALGPVVAGYLIAGGRTLRLRVPRRRPRRAQHALARDAVALVRGRTSRHRPLEPIHARHRRGLPSSADSRHEPRPSGAVRPEWHVERVPAALCPRRDRAHGVATRLALCVADDDDAGGASAHGYAVGPRWPARRNRHGPQCVQQCGVAGLVDGRRIQTHRRRHLVPRRRRHHHRATSAFITDLSRRARYGAAHGVFGTIYDVGDALGPIAAGFLVASIGYARMFQVMAATALLVTLLFHFVAARYRPSAGADDLLS